MTTGLLVLSRSVSSELISIPRIRQPEQRHRPTRHKSENALLILITTLRPAPLPPLRLVRQLLILHRLRLLRNRIRIRRRRERLMCQLGWSGRRKEMRSGSGSGGHATDVCGGGGCAVIARRNGREGDCRSVAGTGHGGGHHGGEVVGSGCCRVDHRRGSVSPSSSDTGIDRAETVHPVQRHCSRSRRPPRRFTRIPTCRPGSSP